jgi:site-specific DNA recombinase
MKKAALYIRVSTLEQAVEGYSIPAQKERLIAFCKAHDWLIADVYVDSGYSGSNLDRPGIQRLISEVDTFDIVLVYKLDRLSRSQRDTLHLIEEVFIPAKVDFVSLNESFDTSTPFGRAMIGILSVFAQLEREQIKERTQMGKLERAKLGLFHGGIFFPIGYDYVGGRLVINDYEAAQVRKIYEWYLDGTAPVKIADRLRDEGYTNKYGSWSEAAVGVSVRNVLSNDVYLGTLKYNEVVVENAHQAIISREDFEKVQELRQKRQEIYGDSPYQTKYLLASMLFCGQCGARYAVKHNYGDYKYYVCYSRSRTVKRMIKADKCENKNWPLDELDARVEAEVKRLLFSPKLYEKLVREKAAEPKAAPIAEAQIITNKITDIDKQISKLMDLYQSDNMPADVLSARIDKLYREKTALTEQLSKIVPPTPKRDYNSEVVTALLADFAAVWEGAEQDERRTIIQALINRIVLDGENIKIEWSFLQD